MLKLLQQTHQEELTVYTNIYNLKEKKITTYYKRKFDQPISTSLDRLFERGKCSYLISDWSEEAVNCANFNHQITLSGTLLNEDSLPLSFATVNVTGTSQGIVADGDGTYSLSISRELINDSITFSYLGYQPITIPIVEAAKEDTLVMFPSSVLLEEVVVEKNSYRKRKRLGYMKGDDGIIPLDVRNGGGEVAILLQAPTAGFYVDEVHFRLMYNSKDTLKFRLHLYSYDSTSNTPGKELLSKNIVLQKNEKRFGWVRFDISEYNVFLRKNSFFLSLEWIDDQSTRERLSSSLRSWEQWKMVEYQNGNVAVELLKKEKGVPISLKYHGNMMKWEGWNTMPPFTGLMVELGKKDKTRNFRTFEKKNLHAPWEEKELTLNAVVVVSY